MERKNVFQLAENWRQTGAAAIAAAPFTYNNNDKVMVAACESRKQRLARLSKEQLDLMAKV